MRPRFSADVWTGAMLSAIAVVNEIAILGPRQGPGARAAARLSRIALIANALLLGVALLLSLASFGVHQPGQIEGLTGLVLAVPPAVTGAAILASRRGALDKDPRS